MQLSYSLDFFAVFTAHDGIKAVFLASTLPQGLQECRSVRIVQLFGVNA